MSKETNYFPNDEDDGPVSTAPAETVLPEDMLVQAPSYVGPPKAVKSLSVVSDEELAAELARRKTAKIDAEILVLEAKLDKLKEERAYLLGEDVDLALFEEPRSQQVPLAVPTDVNPVTGKVRVKLKPGSVPMDKCSCKEGCYLCLRG